MAFGVRIVNGEAITVVVFASKLGKRERGKIFEESKIAANNNKSKLRLELEIIGIIQKIL